ANSERGPSESAGDCWVGMGRPNGTASAASETRLGFLSAGSVAAAAERSMTVLGLRRADRLAGAALAIAMQAGFLALLILSHPLPAPPQKLARELIFLFPPLPHVEPPAPRSQP